MSFGLGISFGRQCRIWKMKRDMGNKTMPPFQRKEIIAKEWESDTWYFKESYFEGDEDRFIGEFNEVKYYISKSVKMWTNKHVFEDFK